MYSVPFPRQQCDIDIVLQWLPQWANRIPARRIDVYIERKIEDICVCMYVTDDKSLHL